MNVTVIGTVGCQQTRKIGLLFDFLNIDFYLNAQFRSRWIQWNKCLARCEFFSFLLRQIMPDFWFSSICFRWKIEIIFRLSFLLNRMNWRKIWILYIKLIKHYIHNVYSSLSLFDSLQLYNAQLCVRIKSIRLIVSFFSGINLVIATDLMPIEIQVNQLKSHLIKSANDEWSTKESHIVT